MCIPTTSKKFPVSGCRKCGEPLPPGDIARGLTICEECHEDELAEFLEKGWI